MPMLEKTSTERSLPTVRLNRPCASVTAAFVVFSSVTVTPGSGARVSSTTVPVTLCWASAFKLVAKRATNTIKTLFI